MSGLPLKNQENLSKEARPALIALLQIDDKVDISIIRMDVFTELGIKVAINPVHVQEVMVHTRLVVIGLPSNIWSLLPLREGFAAYESLATHRGAQIVDGAPAGSAHRVIIRCYNLMVVQ